ncbi:MAG: exodeoxyribonuclease VII large subunit [Lachnospiraceae bacterium]|nr:exodeoxyribonuclease VII large subunit [Lachnospiraceae bacterium]MDE6698044.1 exodeoxyribonuclease VII large subunit [Lachnospiraceae bacterium]
MASIYSVAQVNSYIKHMFEEDFALSDISVRGEISNCKYHTSGHIYFTIKESNSVLACVMFASSRAALKFDLKEGQKVIVSGNVNVYERDGKYQLYAKKITLDGEGDLYKKFELLKKELSEMGMFDSSYKKKIPKYATKIGIVTAATGAAIQDIINISKRRNPYVSLYLYSAIVQGSEACESICKGIETLDKMNLDVIIVGRGGGSIEDLWAFNEEAVARAVFACNTPVISAVGHETDTTIVDYVADLRAPTPSAGAELAVFSYEDFQMDLENITYTLYKELKNKVERKRMILNEYSARLSAKSPKNQIELKKQQISEAYNMLQTIMKRRAIETRSRLNIICERLNGLSPLVRLQCGYSYVSKDGKAIKDINNIDIGDKIEIDVVNGHIKAVVEEISEADRK